MSELLRQRLIDYLQSASAIKTGAVRNAFLEIPREIFIPEVVEARGLDVAYLDEAYPIKTDERGDAISSSSQPQIMALMLEESNVGRGDRVLEIGTGTGYNAALLSALVGNQGAVTSVELDPQLAERARLSLSRARRAVDVIAGDGRSGYAPGAPFDRIVVTASSLDVPKTFLDQLKEGGLLVLPLRIADSLPFQQIVVTFRRIGRELRSISVIRGGFMRLRDRPGDPSLPWFSTDIVKAYTEGERAIGSLSGAGWGALPGSVRGRLSRLCLEAPTSRSLGVRVRTWQQWELQTFIALSVAEELLVGISRDDLADLSFLGTALPAVIDREGKALAHVAGRRTISRIDVFGRPGPDRTLRRVVDDWQLRGRPKSAGLHVRVTYGRSKSRSWRSQRRGESMIAFDW
jgi:protein-L-isoaspartate(D-aspartate) O-methyltransferase